MRDSLRSSILAAVALSALLMFFGCSSNGNNANAPNNANSASSAAQPSSSAPAQNAPAPEPVTIPAGTEIHVVLDTAVSSRTGNPGDTFDATVSSPVVADGRTIIGRDALARGVIVDATPSGRLSKPAMLAIELKSVQSHGAWVEIQTHSLTMEGKSHKKRDIIAIGGGSALGAIIGGIAGGGKGAAIGAAAGGGAGTAGAAYTGKKDITLPAESHLTFRLSRSATVQVQ